MIFNSIKTLLNKNRKRKQEIQIHTFQPKRIKFEEIVGVPPENFVVENPNGVDCMYQPKICKLNDDSTCLSCLQFGFSCQHVASDLIVENSDTGDISTIRKNSKDDEGYCLPNNKYNTEINPYTTSLLLTYSLREQVYNYRTRCLYPHIFNSLNDRSDCDQFHNPCTVPDDPYAGYLVNKDNPSEMVQQNKPVTFDPFYDGRCKTTKFYGTDWNEALGPHMTSLKFNSHENCPFVESCPTGTISSHDTTALIKAGVVPNTIAQMSTACEFCVPAPCENGVYDSDIEECVCDWENGFVGVWEDFSGDGNYVNATIYNNCRGVTIPEEERVGQISTYANTDGSPQFQLKTIVDSDPVFKGERIYEIRVKRNFPLESNKIVYQGIIENVLLPISNVLECTVLQPEALAKDYQPIFEFLDYYGSCNHGWCHMPDGHGGNIQGQHLLRYGNPFCIQKQDDNTSKIVWNPSLALPILKQLCNRTFPSEGKMDIDTSDSHGNPLTLSIPYARFHTNIAVLDAIYYGMRLYQLKWADYHVEKNCGGSDSISMGEMPVLEPIVLPTDVFGAKNDGESIVVVS